MNTIARLRKRVGSALSASALLIVAAGCHSYHIEATVENRTGATITLLEVDYPTASFGADTLAVDQVFHHRIQTRDSGPISVQYTAGHGRQVLVTGPTLYEKQEGSIEIVLLPNGKAEFHPALSPPN
jgi:hypothetical protein